MVTFKQILTAIAGSVEKWDKIGKGNAGDYGRQDCPLCLLFRRDGNYSCAGCPVQKKTGEKDCRGTRYWDFKHMEGKDNAIALGYAAKFRDWLKDLYIEVSEKGDVEPKKDRDTMTNEEYFKRLKAAKPKWESAPGARLKKIVARIIHLEAQGNAAHNGRTALRLNQDEQRKRIDELEKRIKEIEGRWPK